MEPSISEFAIYLGILFFFISNSLPVIAITGLMLSAFFKKKKLSIAFIIFTVILLIYYWLESDPYHITIGF